MGLLYLSLTLWKSIDNCGVVVVVVVVVVGARAPDVAVDCLLLPATWEPFHIHRLTVHLIYISGKFQQALSTSFLNGYIYHISLSLPLSLSQSLQMI